MSSTRAPRFSILLPTHNRANVLRFAIRSALGQSVGDFELLIAGDGCTDETAQVVASFGDPRVRWFDLPKAPGIGYKNRNVALREARGHHIAYLAHDDIWFPDHLERVGRLLDDTGAEFAYSRGLEVGLDGRMTPYWYNLGVPGHRAALGRGDSSITMCAVVHARSCLTRYGYWDEALLRSADKELWHRIAAGGEFKNLAFLPEPTALHFVANWRNTPGYRARKRLASMVSDGLLDGVLGDALRLPTSTSATQQEAAWNWLALEPEARVRDIRRAVVQFQDAILWRSRTPPGLLGLRVGMMLGTTLDRVSRAALWLASGKRRRLVGDLRRRMEAIESARR
jgi:hypothetical protein